MTLSASTISIVKATAPAVGKHAVDITRNFYPRMLAANPEVLSFFNTANQHSGRQAQALADAVVGYATHLEHLEVLGPAVERMVHKHVALQVMPEGYKIVHKHLMDAIGDVLGDAITPEVGNAWSEAVLHLAGILTGAEDQLRDELERAPGGWRGWRSFTVSQRTESGGDRPMVHLSLVPTTDADKGVMASAGGTYATVRLPPDVLYPVGDVPPVVAPRHYSVVASDDGSLELCVRKLDGGLYSTYIHEKLHEGSTIEVAAPCGAFHHARDRGAGTDVFIAGGVGFTALARMSAESQQQGRTATMVHAVTDPRDATFARGLVPASVPMRTVQTAFGQAPLVRDMLADVDGTDEQSSFFVCAPPPMIRAVKEGLMSEGVPSERIHYEAFGPHLSD